MVPFDAVRDSSGAGGVPGVRFAAALGSA